MQDLKAIRFIEGTKISHDYQDNDVTTFSYRQLFEMKVPAVGIPAKQNRLVIIDVDVISNQHKHDGREWWFNFCKESNLQPTYTVRTPSGGYHFYYRLPEHVNEHTFFPPAKLADGVDVKWNGWVGAPPTSGYVPEYGDLTKIIELPQPLIDYIAELVHSKPIREFDETNPNAILETHRPFTPAQIADLRGRLQWMQIHGNLSYSEWRDGLFALKAGVADPVELDELLLLWTYNKSYQSGDEHKARDIVERATAYGGVGPGTIINLIRNAQIREGAATAQSPFSMQEIFDKSKIPLEFDKNNKIKIPVSESNAAALIGAMFPKEDMYFDIRADLYIYKGDPISDTDLVNIIMPIIQSQSDGLGLDRFRKNYISAGLDIVMTERQVDPHIEYLKSVKWDGVKRIETFCSKYLKTEDTEYTRLVGKNLWTALAARGLKPGQKFDTMVVLEGRQGISKSSIIEAIGGEYTFAPSDKKALENLDDLRKMHQSVVVELPELVGLVGQSELQVKNFLAKRYDHIRGLYARKAMKSLRGFVFIGSTNDSRYLLKGMGGRRFWPLRIPDDVKSVDLQGVKSDRDQLFAEGVHSFREGYAYWDMPDHLLGPVIQDRVYTDPIKEAIIETISRLGDSWTTLDVYKHLEIGNILVKGFNRFVSERIDNYLRDLKCTQDVYSGRWSGSNVPAHMPAELTQFVHTSSSALEALM